MRTIVLIFLVIGLSASAAQTTLYRWVDEQGRVHYSDRPQPDAEAVEVDEPMTYSAPQPQLAPTLPPGERYDETPGDAFAGYSSVGVTAPAQDQVLWNIGGTLAVSLSVQPPLQQGHSIRVTFNGAAVADWPAASTSHTLQNVYRGTHTLAVAIIDDSGNVVAASEPVTFYVKQTSILN